MSKQTFHGLLGSMDALNTTSTPAIGGWQGGNADGGDGVDRGGTGGDQVCT